MVKIIEVQDKKVKIQDLDSLELSEHALLLEKDEFIRGDFAFFYDGVLLRVYHSTEPELN